LFSLISAETLFTPARKSIPDFQVTMIKHSSQTLLLALVAYTTLQKKHLLYTIDLPVRGALMPK
jgi:hypothetical protein